MTIRRTRPKRLNSRTHLFKEGSVQTLCETLLTDSYVVCKDDAIPTCEACLRAYVKLEKETA